MFDRVSRFLEGDEAGVTLERSRLSLDGSASAEPEVDRVDCLRYTVRDGATKEVFWFATDLPGMPLQCLTRTDGRVGMTVSVVDDTLT